MWEFCCLLRLSCTADIEPCARACVCACVCTCVCMVVVVVVVCGGGRATWDDMGRYGAMRAHVGRYGRYEWSEYVVVGNCANQHLRPDDQQPTNDTHQ